MDEEDSLQSAPPLGDVYGMLMVLHVIPYGRTRKFLSYKMMLTEGNRLLLFFFHC